MDKQLSLLLEETENAVDGKEEKILEIKRPSNIDFLQVMGSSIRIQGEYICLTDMAKSFGGERSISSWMRAQKTLDFLDIWERNSNLNYEPHRSVSSDFTPTKWIKTTKATGMYRTDKATYAHKDIAHHFGMWLKPEYALHVIREYEKFQELKIQQTTKADWKDNRDMSKLFYRVQTDAIAAMLPPDISQEKASEIYAIEANLLDLAVFNERNQEWRKRNPNAKKSENMRDSATIEELLVLSGLESVNAGLILQDIPRPQRYEQLKNMAQSQLKRLFEKSNPSIKRIKNQLKP